MSNLRWPGLHLRQRTQLSRLIDHLVRLVVLGQDLSLGLEAGLRHRRLLRLLDEVLDGSWCVRELLGLGPLSTSR